MKSKFAVRINVKEKEDFAAICHRQGISVDEALRVLIRRFNDEGGFPFPMTLDLPSCDDDEDDPFYSEENMKHLQKVKEDFEASRISFITHSLLDIE